MSELIEKQAVIDALLAKMDTIDDKPEVVLGLAVAAGTIKDMPSALDQEPCDDAISRQDLREPRFIIAENDYQKGWNDALDSVYENAPPVTSAEKVGNWIAQDIHNCHTDFRCSECGYIHSFMHLYGKPTADYTYCPNCGAKMSEIPTSCSTCILDNTDACTRGAGRAVDDEACEDYLASPTGAEGSEE